MAEQGTATKRRVGRPLKFESPEVMLTKAQEYFNDTPREEWTITGVAVYLDTSRVTLMEYEGKPEFVNAIKKIKDQVEMAYEISLRKRGGSGDIFGLKNFGWRDKFETDITTDGDKIQASVLPEELIGQFHQFLASSTKQ
ncbi:hypothetical protein H0X10_04635 [Candidatus Saccharibacteria bacterium]|nr:hypothetical protein [Candidatus Saccharibacteria bacterium]